MDALGRYRRDTRGDAAHRLRGDDLTRAVTLEALSEVIREQRGDGADKSTVPTPTEYFASLMTALQGPRGPQRNTLLFLLSMVIGAVPASVMRLKGEACLGSLTSILRQESDASVDNGEDDPKAVRYCISAIGAVLAALEPSAATWDRAKNNQGLLLLFNTVADPRPKVRKVAKQALVGVLKGQAPNPAPFKTVCQAAYKALKSATVSDCSQVMMLLAFLELSLADMARFAPAKELAAVASAMCKTVRLGHITLSTTAFRCVCILVKSISSNDDTVSPEKKMAEIEPVISKLVDISEDPVSLKFVVNDPKLCVAWIAALQASEAGLYRVSSAAEKLSSKLPQVAKALMTCITSGLALAVTSEVPPMGLAQVTIPTGSLAHIIRTEGAIEQQPELVLKVMEVIEPLFSAQFEDSWPITLDIIRGYFESRAGSSSKSSAVVLKKEHEWVKKLVSIRESAIDSVTGMDKKDLVLRWKGAVERAVGAAIAGLGVESALQAAPLRGDDPNMKGILPLRSWLLPILRESASSGAATTSLEYFRTDILPIAQECEELSHAKNMGKNSSKMLVTRAMQLWSLFPSFCTNASDVATPEGFTALAPLLGQTLQDERFPELTEYICVGLRALILHVEGNAEDEKAVGQFAQNFMPLLFNKYDELICEEATERADFVHKLVAAYSIVAPKELTNTLFRQLLEQLLVATTAIRESSEKDEKREEKQQQQQQRLQQKSNYADREEDNSSDEEADEESEEENEIEMEDDLDDENRRKTHILSSLALAVVPVLEDESITMLFRCIKPFLEDEDDAILQKRGYRVFEAILQNQVAWVLERREELMELMRNSFFASNASSKTSRLKCIGHIVDAFQSEQSNLSIEKVTEMVADIISEVVLCTKETNKKARAACFKLLVNIPNCLAHVYEQEGGKRSDGVRQCFHLVVAALAAKTPHMQSAALNSLCRLFGEFGTEEDLQQDFIEISEAGLLMLQEKSREVAKSAISFAKVICIRLPVETVKQLLPDILNALLPWSLDSKNRFSTRIRVVFERLTKRVGDEAILETGIIPSDHKVINYIRKRAAYKKRLNERQQTNENPRDRRDRRGGAPNNDDDNDDDDEDEDEDGGARQRGKRKRGRHVEATEEDIVMDENEEAIDLLGASALGRVKRGAKKKQAGGDDDMGGFKVANDGRIVVPGEQLDDGPANKNGNGSDDDDDGMGSGKRRRVRYESDDEDESGKRDRAKREQADKRQHRPAGAEFKAKNAGGDVKKKASKFEPYAYIALDPKMLNKRRKHESSRQFRGIGGKKFQVKVNNKNKKKN